MKSWSKPVLRQFGNIEEITMTGQVKLKSLGLSDDFGITGITNPKQIPV